MSKQGIVKPALKLTPLQWVICIIAVIGFAFDTYEILMLPLILRPAIFELTGLQPGSPEYVSWARSMFYVPAFAAGIFADHALERACGLVRRRGRAVGWIPA